MERELNRRKSECEKACAPYRKLLKEFLAAEIPKYILREGGELEVRYSERYLKATKQIGDILDQIDNKYFGDKEGIRF